MNEREHLQNQLAWLIETIDGYRASQLPPSWRDDSIKRTEAQIADIRYRLEIDPPRPAPICGWTKSHESHTWPCPKHDTRCNAQMGIVVPRDLKRLRKTDDHQDL